MSVKALNLSTYNPLSVSRMADGLCRRCGEYRGESTNRQLCVACSVEARAYFKLRYKNALQQEICVTCLTVPKEIRIRCAPCWFKGIAHARTGKRSLWKLLQEKLILQQYQCVYSGRLLVPGKNASLEHVLPVSTHPELRAETSNLIWCDLNVNRAKSAMSYVDFLAMCTDIVQHRKLVCP